MRIAIISPETAPIPPIRGGAIQHCIWESAPLIARRVEELFVLSPADPDLPREETLAGVRYHRLPYRKNLGWRNLWQTNRGLSYALAVARRLKEIRPDIVHIMGRPTMVKVVRQAFGPRIKIILHLRNSLRDRDIAASLMRDSRPRCDAFASISRFLLESALPKCGLSPEQGWVIYNGVNLEHFKPAGEIPENRAAARRRYGLADDERVVLFAGRLQPSKGIHYLAEAMDEVFQAVPKAAFLLVGAPRFGAGHTEKLDKFSKQILGRLSRLPGKVINQGFIPPAQMPEVYPAADVFAAPAIWEEPLGNVYLEAQACGLPVVGTKRGGIPEIVQDGVTGFLLEDPADTKSLAGVIIDLLNDKEKSDRLGRAGRRQAEQFTWERNAEETAALYRSLLCGK
jgi:spore coat protein SA